VPAGSRLRARFRVEAVERIDGGVQATVASIVEREGGTKPACVAETVFRLLR
jgi:acyl dehydratase